MHRVARQAARAAVSAALLSLGCTYLPIVVFSNPTDAPLQLQVDLDNPECPKPALMFMPSSQAYRRWRSQDVRPVPPEAAEHHTNPCQLVAEIPPRTALKANMSYYYHWTPDGKRDLLALSRVSLEGSRGSICVSGSLLAAQFDRKWLGYFVWVYGDS
jgi:hypothetical protein